MGNPLKKIEPWIDPIGNQGQKAIAHVTGLGADPKNPNANLTKPGDAGIGQNTPAPINPYLTGKLRAEPGTTPMPGNPSAPAESSTGAPDGYAPNAPNGYTPNYFEANSPAPTSSMPPPAAPTAPTPPPQAPPPTSVQAPGIGPAGPGPVTAPGQGPAGAGPVMAPGQAPPSAAPAPVPPTMMRAPTNSATQGRFNPALIAGLRG